MYNLTVQLTIYRGWIDPIEKREDIHKRVPLLQIERDPSRDSETANWIAMPDFELVDPETGYSLHYAKVEWLIHTKEERDFLLHGLKR